MWCVYILIIASQISNEPEEPCALCCNIYEIYTSITHSNKLDVIYKIGVIL